MWEWKYAKEPLNMKLLLLRLLNNIKIIIIAALLGAAIIGGGHTISKVFFSGPVEYEMSQRYYIQYEIDPQVLIEYTFISGATWDTWVKSDWFTQRIWDYTLADGLDPTQYGLGQEDLASFMSGELETDLRIVKGTVRTPYMALTEKLSKALTKTMQDFAEQQIEIEEIRLVDTVEVAKVDKNLRVINALVLGTVLGCFFGLLGVIVYLVLDDAIYLPSVLTYRYGSDALGCAFDTVNGLELQPGTTENIKNAFADLEKVAITSVGEDLSLPDVAKLFEEIDFVCVPSICQVPEAISVLQEQEGILLLVQAGKNCDASICHVLEQLRIHDCKVKGMLLVEADKRMVKLMGLPVKGE